MTIHEIFEMLKTDDEVTRAVALRRLQDKVCETLVEQGKLERVVVPEKSKVPPDTSRLYVFLNNFGEAVSTQGPRDYIGDTDAALTLFDPDVISTVRIVYQPFKRNMCQLSVQQSVYTVFSDSLPVGLIRLWYCFLNQEEDSVIVEMSA